jgi:hypothetical protein
MPGKVLDADDAKQMGALLASLHCGVLAMSFDVAGLVQASTNLATVDTKGGAASWRRLREPR